MFSRTVQFLYRVCASERAATLTECLLCNFSSRVKSVPLGNRLSSFTRANRPSFYDRENKRHHRPGEKKNLSFKTAATLSHQYSAFVQALRQLSDAETENGFSFSFFFKQSDWKMKRFYFYFRVGLDAQKI